MDRRALLQVGLSISAILTGVAKAMPQAMAEDYPSRPIRLVVAYAPGGTTDFVARLVGEKMGELAGARFVVDNKPGAAGAIGMKDVARSDPDGYTMLLGDSTMAITPTLNPGAGIEPLEMFAPVGLVGTFPSVLVVHPDVPAASAQELIAYAQAHPGELNFGSGGNGTVPHLQGELFKLRTGVDIVHVPYKGNAAALQDLLGGNIQMVFTAGPTALPFIKSGQLKLLATTGMQRLPLGVDAPTLIEAGVPDFISAQWFGLLAPKGTPEPIVNRLNELLDQAMKDPALAQKISEQGGFLQPGTPADFAQFIASEEKSWGDIVRAAKVEQ